jgi:hypothetical protein
MRKLLVFLVASGLLFMFAVPVMAEEEPADNKSLENRVKALEEQTLESRVKKLEQTLGSWSFYGSLRYQTFYEDSQNSIDHDDAGTTWDQALNSRIGAIAKKDRLGGQLELGIDDDNNNVYTRLFFATYDFGKGKVLFGQDYTPIGHVFQSNQVFSNDNDLLGWGQSYEGRVAQVKIMVKNLQVAFVKNKATSTLNAAADEKGNKGDYDIYIPKIELNYRVDMANGKFYTDIFGGFSSFKVEKVKKVTFNGTTYDVDPDKDWNVNSWLAGVRGGIKLDPAYINASFYYGQNAKNFGLVHTDSGGALIDGHGHLKNEDNLGVLLVAGTKIDVYTVEAGFGYVYSELDAKGFEKDDAMSYYINCTIPVYGGFFLVPEIGVLDRCNNYLDKNQYDKVTYFGAKWQINF